MFSQAHFKNNIENDIIRKNLLHSILLDFENRKINERGGPNNNGDVGGGGGGGVGLFFQKN